MTIEEAAEKPNEYTPLDRALDELWEFTGDEYKPAVIRKEHIRILRTFAEGVRAEERARCAQVADCFEGDPGAASIAQLVRMGSPATSVELTRDERETIDIALSCGPVATGKPEDPRD